ncbi:hypothetical protein FRY74_06150 [Vicingus serpentipes]|uniref:Uncharacterized protein n=1 Tax=Vicingus serpentipes TaxID=1926625 RepID=A0A5C6RUY2_9FLAO|nr:hypothetical protein [Vicingus serpentipes]TXB66151.1 hypothetical protein FRY74_06150 [Vicingus serpentipes]
MQFYKIFKFGDLIGVNQLSFTDLIKVQFTVLIIYIILFAFFALALPSLLFTLYIVWMITGDGGKGYDGRNIEQRLYINIFTILSVIYFLVDFHLGWISMKVTSSAFSKETLDSIAAFNLNIGILNLILFFVGHEIYYLGGNRIFRILIFLVAIYYGAKISNSISYDIISKNNLQYNNEEIEKMREEMSNFNKYNNESTRIKHIEKEKLRLEERERKLKEFDENFAENYLK